MFRRDWPLFSVLERKRRLLAIIPAVECRLLFLYHVAGRGPDLFRMAEGIVAKWAEGSYRTDGRATSWLKIKNPDYTQVIDRHELFADCQRHECRPRSMVSRRDLLLR